MNGLQWVNVSETAKHLIRALMEVDPTKRLNTEQILKHRWFTDDPEIVLASKTAMWGAEAHTEDSGVDLRSFKSKKARMDLNERFET